MAYVKIIYQNSPSTATPINAQNLNHMDDGIAENDRRLNELETAGVVNKFNNRTGNVTPEKNDYDISLIGATAGEDGYVPVWRNSGTEEDPNWGFEMEQQGGAGHVLVDSDGNDMPSEDRMQFADAFLIDDSVNGKTVIENIKPVTRAQFDVATEDGFYGIIDEDDATIEPASEDYVEAEASSDTMGSLISKLFLEVDWDKVTDYAYLTLSDVGVAYYLASLDRIDRNNENAIFTRANVSSGGARVYYFYLGSSGQYYIAKGATAEEDHSSDNVSNGTVLALHYGTSSAVTNLINQAKYTYLESGESVEQAMYVQSHGSQTVIEQSSWDTTTGDTTVTATHTGYLVGTFNVHSCNGGGAYTHGVIVFIDYIPVANIYSQGDSTAEANSGSFCIPIKKGQVVIVRVNNGTWLGKAYIRY